MKRLLCATACAICCQTAGALQISKKAIININRIDALDVAHHWLAGGHVDWQTGEPDGKAEQRAGRYTHCSAFAAAAANLFGIYLLRPPRHSQLFLASAQADWLATSDAKKRGWVELKGAAAAQKAADEGEFVVAVYKSHHAHKPGHIAIVRPSRKSLKQLAEEGPEITQAGDQNFISTTVRIGFSHHADAIAKNEIHYFAHPIGG